MAATPTATSRAATVLTTVRIRTTVSNAVEREPYVDRLAVPLDGTPSITATDFLSSAGAPAAEFGEAVRQRTAERLH
jgi:hypothetical protein